MPTPEEQARIDAVLAAWRELPTELLGATEWLDRLRRVKQERMDWVGPRGEIGSGAVQSVN